jgi:hypothetical protein
METYLQFAQQIPCEKLNVYIQRHGYKALDPQKVSAKEVAKGLELIVERDGMSAYQELQNLISLKNDDIVENEKKCDCKSRIDKKRKRKKLFAERNAQDYTEDSDVEEEIDSNVTEGEDIIKIEDNSDMFIKKHSTLLILVTTAIIITLIIKKS